MSRYHYQPHQHSVSTRRYGELLPNIYVPPLEKFQGTTTTGDAYQGRAGPPARACIPEGEKITQSGTHDHNTNYRTDYQSHGLSLCAAKVYAIAQNQQTASTPVSVQ